MLRFITHRRADVAKEVLEELEFFYLRLEQLVSWQYLMHYDEWGKTFNDIFRSHFLIAKLKAHKLKKTKVNSCLESMKKNISILTGRQRLITQIDSQGQLFYKAEVPKAEKEFNNGWKQFCEEWANLKDILYIEGHYEMPDKPSI